MSHETIGRRLRELRNEAGFTQNEAAKELGISQSMVMQIERGTKQLSLLNADRLAKMYRCTKDDMLGKEDKA